MLLKVVTLPWDVGHDKLPGRDLDSGDLTDLGEREEPEQRRGELYGLFKLKKASLNLPLPPRRGLGELRLRQGTYCRVGLLWLRCENPDADSLLLGTSLECWRSDFPLEGSVSLCTRDPTHLEGRGGKGKRGGEGATGEEGR